jgi:hypothetical protein
MFHQDVRIASLQSKIAHAAIAGCVIMLLALALPAAAQNGPKYKVTVTNLTRGSAFTPILVASHLPGLRLFVPGTPASAELATLAETGNPAPLQTLIAPSTFDSVVVGSVPLAPGGTAMAMVATRGPYDHISVASMLVPTNDAFFAVNGIQGPKGNKTIMVLSPAYDAGTEENDENCSSPSNGGPCGTGASVGEGYVHVHAGIHGVGDLTAADFDWRNPVARIVIERIP